MSDAWLRMLVDTSIRAPVAAVFVAGALAAFRVRATAVRHASWTGVLFAMLLMPVLPYFVPAIATPVSIAIPPLPDVIGNRMVGASQAVRINAAPDPIRAAPADPTAVRSGEPATAVAWVRPYAPKPAPRPSQDARWLLYAAGAYYVVALAMLARVLVGWCGAARMARASQPVSPPREWVAFTRSRNDVNIRESPLVVVPVTIGVLAPTILLPVTWTRWPRETLRAVLAHEAAHVQRRDVLVAFVAHLNRCLFWFHPFSWWLARTLASSAEQASDDMALSAVGDRTAYAEILLDMARAVSHRRGRISWLGAGIDGRGVLDRRIEHVLGGDVRRDMSAARKSLLALVCTTAILLVVACRPSPALLHDSAAFQQRDRAIRAQLEQLDGSPFRHFASVDWDADPDSVRRLEAAVTANPDDIGALRRFLIAYWVQYAPRPAVGSRIARNGADRKLLAARRAHILRLIEHHPDSELAAAGEALIVPRDLEPFFPGDPVGYAQAKALWVAHANRPNVSAAVLGHAASFLEPTDRPLAEQMLLRARALDPQGPWAVRLGRLYAIALVGAWAPAGRNAVRTVSVAEPRSAHGQAIRRTLGESTDEVLLTAAGWFLARAGSGRPGIDFNPSFWAESCFKRALQINPHAVLAHSALLENASRARGNREALWRVPPASRDATVAALPEAERFQQLPGLARGAFTTLEDLSRWDDHNLNDRRTLARAQAKRYSEETLALAPKFRADPSYGTAIYTVNMTLSALALRDGDRKKAVEYLRRASHAPASEELTYSGHIVSGWRFIRDLLAQGERQAVIDFLDRMARTNLGERMDLREAAAALRRGETPLM